MIPVTAVFDIGKTNKKFFLFDDHQREVYHSYQKFQLIEDEDGFECDDLGAIAHWVLATVDQLLKSVEYDLKAVNFSTYGATLVHVDQRGVPVTPLYNYLKPFPEELRERFIHQYGSDENDVQTASPMLGMLNSGLQLYWLKHHKPELFKRIGKTLHFPQYLSSLLTGKQVSEPTSIGCHTKLWDFQNRTYHRWVYEEGFETLLPEVVPTAQTYGAVRNGKQFTVGVGIHDSSSALASYQLRTSESFLLVSTGTWSITLNPFTNEPLTAEELHRDCLNFLDIHGNAIKASRLFLGSELDHQLEALEAHFHKAHGYYKQVGVRPDYLADALSLDAGFEPRVLTNELLVKDTFGQKSPRDISTFSSFDEVYHHMIGRLAMLQSASVRLATGRSGVRKVFIDGGFIHNPVFLDMLNRLLPDMLIEVSAMPLGSALGAALVLEGRK